MPQGLKMGWGEWTAGDGGVHTDASGVDTHKLKHNQTILNANLGQSTILTHTSENFVL